MLTPWLARAELAPPEFPDGAHVPNGCFLSALAYLSRFAAKFPAERGETVHLDLPNADGSIKPHTIALVTWHGRWWGRDEYFGRFPLGPALAPPDGNGRLALVVGRAMADGAARRRELVGQLEAAATQPLTPGRRAEAVRLARTLLPVSSEIVWLRAGGESVPFLFFRTGPGRIAVYDPAYGTATAGCHAADGVSIVVAVAARLGYGRSQPLAGSLPFS
jgi:hypothetical protein